MTRSAYTSYSVGSRFTMTNFAPFSLATSGNMFAGETDKEEPRTINRSLCFASTSACWNVSCGKLSPNKTMPGRIVPPQSQLERPFRSEEHTSELQSRFDLVCRLLLEKKKKKKKHY